MSVHPRSVPAVDDVTDTLAPIGTELARTGWTAGGALASAAGPVVDELLARLDDEHLALSGLPARERLLAAAWLASYRSARTRRAYAADLDARLRWLCAVGIHALHVSRVHVDLYVRRLLDTGAAASSTSRRLSALSSFYRHLVEHDLMAANPAAAVRRPSVDPDHTATVGLDRDQARAFLAAADADTGPARLRTAAAARLLLHLGLRVDELASRANGAGGPLLAIGNGGWLDQAALWMLVRRLARAAAIPSWAQLSPHSLRHTAITLALRRRAAARRAGLRRAPRPAHHAALRSRPRHPLDRNAAYTLTAYLA